MTKILSLFCILTLMAACNNRPNEGDISSTFKKSDSSSSFVTNIDDSEIDLPSDLRLATVHRFDSIKNTEIFLEYPLSLNGMAEYDSEIKKVLNRQLNDFLKELTVHNDSFMPNIFEAGVVAADMDSDVLSYCFIVSTYTSHAVHPYTIYYSFHYDLKKKKQIFFADYFSLTNKSDTSAFKAILNSANSRPDDFGIRYPDKVCFYPKKDSMVFLFDDFDGNNDAIEITKATVSKAKVRVFINNIYR